MQVTRNSMKIVAHLCVVAGSTLAESTKYPVIIWRTKDMRTINQIGIRDNRQIAHLLLILSSHVCWCVDKKTLSTQRRYCFYSKHWAAWPEKRVIFPKGVLMSRLLQCHRPAVQLRLRRHSRFMRVNDRSRLCDRLSTPNRCDVKY